MLAQYEIGVIGSGNAAEGIVHAILRNTILFADRIVASDPSESRRKLFADRFQIAVTADNRKLVAESDIIILAVKPQQFSDMLKSVADLFTERHLIVSIMAGVSTRTLESFFAPRPVRL